ncbi:MAG: hypothetical protein RLZZ142_1969 [Verrucomicrobiota bacterium]
MEPGHPEAPRRGRQSPVEYRVAPCGKRGWEAMWGGLLVWSEWPLGTFLKAAPRRMVWSAVVHGERSSVLAGDIPK